MDAKALHRLYRQLRRNHPELLGLGIGWRTKGGRVTREPAIRLVVAEKRSKRNKSVRQFPSHIELKSGRGKRPVSIKIFTDVEEVGQWVPTSFPLLVGGLPKVIAACYASWEPTPGDRRVGVVTVAHAFPGPGQAVGVTTAGGVANGVLKVRSDLIKDGYDVGLIELQDPDAPYLPCLSPELNPGAASVNVTINLLGLSETDSAFAAMDVWFSAKPAAGRALAYYVARTIKLPTGQSYVLKSVIAADGGANTYAPGRSGSPWVVNPDGGDPLAVGLQSHGNSGQSFRQGLGTHLGTALEWLTGQPDLANLGWAWRFEDLP